MQFTMIMEKIQTSSWRNHSDMMTNGVVGWFSKRHKTGGFFYRQQHIVNETNCA